jgi:hypothetical protein
MKKILSILTLLVASSAFSQTLPAPSREVFKCEEGGKVVYSDAPCLGAKRVGVEPTRGLNKLSGTERIGADVRQEKHKEQMAEALRPLLGETAEQYSKRHRRATLTPKSQGQCGRLDQEIQSAEQAEREAAKGELLQAQDRLYRIRKQYIDLRC